jgi:hypothetical protein
MVNKKCPNCGLIVTAHKKKKDKKTKNLCEEVLAEGVKLMRWWSRI